MVSKRSVKAAKAAPAKRKRAPVGQRRARAGRPEFEVTQEQRDKVRMLVGSGMDVADVAIVMGCVRQTLYKYFPDEIRHARVIMKAEALELVWKQAREGSSPMIRRAVELTSVPRDRGDFIREVSREAQEPKAEKIGKKEALKRAADNPDKSDALGALMAERMAAGDLN